MGGESHQPWGAFWMSKALYAGRRSMKEPTKTIAIIIGFLLLIAILPLPYGYYTFLRLVVFGGGLFLAYQLYEQKLHKWSVVMAVLAVLFNPFIPVYLSRETWLPIDIVGAITFLVVGGKLEKKA
jgi:hypothetical protein